MRRAGHPRRTFRFGVAASVGLLLVGIGCMGCAVANIEAQSAASNAALRSAPSSPAASAVEQPAPSGNTGGQVASYSRYPAAGDVVGTLSIPALNKKLPIVEGTDDADLKRGVGHFSQSVLPGEMDNCVLSGHRDTVFTSLGKLKVGDRFITRTSAGAFTYKIRRIRIVHKNDTTIIVPADHAVLTVSTCYPFHFVGAAPDRYVLIADLVTGG